MNASTTPQGSLDVELHGPASRGVAAALELLAALSVLGTAALVAFDILTGELTMPPGRMVLAVAALVLLPLLAARLIGLLRAARLTRTAETLVVETRWARYEAPLAAVARVRAWRLPLPRPGVTLVTADRRLRVAAADPAAVLAALDLPRPEHATLVYAAAKAMVRRRWYAVVFKLVVFPLLPALVFFRLHQYIAYGGWRGEWQMLGLASYLRTLVRFVASTTATLVLYAGLWRGVAELWAWSVAALAPARARGARRSAEMLARVAYYVGIPALVAARFLM